MKNESELAREGENRADTRAAVVGLLMERGQATAPDIGSALGITTTAVRRHLDNLLAAGDVAVASPPSGGERGRGRPAREFVLTAVGRRRLQQGYDALAAEALRALRELGGDDAVRAFADRRAAAALGAAGEPAEPADPGGPGDGSATDSAAGARRIAAALSDAGFAADTRQMPNGVQICQHHCPVSEVAAEFPELCEAEISAIERALGTHVQRLATIANGDRACTTHVPIEYVDAPTRRAKPMKELR